MNLSYHINLVLKKSALILVLINLTVCILVLSGWIFRQDLITQIRPDYMPMSITAAVFFLILNSALLICPVEDRLPILKWPVMTLVALVLSVSTAMLVDFGMDRQIGLEQWYYRTFLPLPRYEISHISPITLVILMLSSISVFIWMTSSSRDNEARKYSARFSTVTAIISYIILTGYLYNAPFFYSSKFVSVSLPAAIVSLLLSLALICLLGKSFQPLRSFLGSSVYAQLMRYFIPIVIFLIVFQGWADSILFPQYQHYPYIAVAITTVSALGLPIIIYRKGLTISKAIDEANAISLQAIHQLSDALFYNRNLIDISIDPMVTINHEGVVTDANMAAGVLRGIPADKLVGTDFADYFTDPDLARKGFQKVRECGFIKDYPLTIRQVSGQTRDILYNAVVYKNLSGIPMGVFATARDITERKIIEEQLAKSAAILEQSNRDLQQYSYITTHDLQEPLRVIAGFLQLLEHRYKGKLDRDADEFIDFAVNAAVRLQNMINDLMIYTRLESRAKPFESTDCNLVLTETLKRLQSEIEATRATVTHDVLPVVMGDRDQILTVFKNLLINSLKFHLKDVAPVIHVSAHRTKNEWLFRVTDNGIGIAPRNQNEIFTVFKRFVGREYPGTGMGLAMCKKIIDRHEGRIWVESEPEKGSTFYFTLPAVTE